MIREVEISTGEQGPLTIPVDSAFFDLIRPVDLIKYKGYLYPADIKRQTPPMSANIRGTVSV